jgi:hypothetical protein
MKKCVMECCLHIYIGGTRNNASGNWTFDLWHPKGSRVQKVNIVLNIASSLSELSTSIPVSVGGDLRSCIVYEVKKWCMQEFGLAPLAPSGIRWTPEVNTLQDCGSNVDHFEGSFVLAFRGRNKNWSSSSDVDNCKIRSFWFAPLAPSGIRWTPEVNTLQDCGSSVDHFEGSFVLALRGRNKNWSSSSDVDYCKIRSFWLAPLAPSGTLSTLRYGRCWTELCKANFIKETVPK